MNREDTYTKLEPGIDINLLLKIAINSYWYQNQSLVYYNQMILTFPKSHAILLQKERADIEINIEQ
jgi:hypothetical protein